MFDFDEETRSARLKSLHVGVSKDEVVERSGFEVIIPETVPTTDGPTADELVMLRTRIDSQGALRT